MNKKTTRYDQTFTISASDSGEDVKKLICAVVDGLIATGDDIDWANMEIRSDRLEVSERQIWDTSNQVTEWTEITITARGRK